METVAVTKVASKGIVMGHALVIQEQIIAIDERTIDESQKEQELQKFYQAVERAIQDLKLLAVDSAIFEAHLAVAEDEVLHDAVQEKINQDNHTAEKALSLAVGELVAMFESIDDEYLRERSADVSDVGKRILYHLKGIPLNRFAGISRKSIVLAEDLTPSDTANMDFQFVNGFITQHGGSTSHVAIMARSMELPAMVGVDGILNRITNGQFVILDGVEKEIIIDPDQETIALYEEKAAAYKEKKKALAAVNHLPATTLDGRTVSLFANVGSMQGVLSGVQNGAEGIGLFRSEFLYMESSKFPTEMEQFAEYKKAVEAMKAPVIIRTLDIGGDKDLSYYHFEKEENPFLGWRAIRMCLEMRDVFKTQLKALLRASAFGDIRIMYPMIISVEEFLEANAILEECKLELKEKHIPFNSGIETGVMIETPAAVFCAQDLAKVADFFSIGTNDLTQYLLAVDRGNQKISKLYNTFHPAVLRAIQQVIHAAHKEGKPVGMCGEFASDEEACLLLLGMGLDEFSMASSEIANVRYRIRQSNYQDLQALAKTVCEKSTIAEILTQISSKKQ